MNKRLCILPALLALLGLASCQQDQLTYAGQDAASGSEGDAISFNVKTSEAAVSRAAMMTADSIKKHSIGVFAFQQLKKSNGEPYNFNHTIASAGPDFMYNQKLEWDKTNLKWDYDPHKFWSNDSCDQYSFFFYAPYKKGMAWEELPVESNTAGSKLTVSLPVSPYVDEEVDQMWATPQLNKHKQALTDSVAVNLKHCTAKVVVYLAAGKPDATIPLIKAQPMYWTDKKNSITINSVTYKNQYQNAIYRYNVTDGKIDDTKIDTLADEKVQDVKLTSEHFVAEAATIDYDHWNSASASEKWDTTTGFTMYKQVQKDDCIMFLAPKTYEDGAGDCVISVTTKDVDDGIEQTFTRTADLYDILTTQNHRIEAGKFYKIYCLVSFDAIQFTVTVEPWTEADPINLDIK